MSLSVLNCVKSKLLNGDFNMAASYYSRAIDERVEPCVVNLRYLTKEYLVYPLEYEQSIGYFELIEQLKAISKNNNEYISEYKQAAASLADIRRLFLRSISLFYFFDILVSSSGSVVLHEISEISEYFGKSFKELLLDERMKRAEELVLKSEIPISRLIEAVGYENESYFHKEFKKRYGQSPLALRRQPKNAK